MRSIKIPQELKDKLDSLKVHKRETYYDVISRLANSKAIVVGAGQIHPMSNSVSPVSNNKKR